MNTPHSRLLWAGAGLLGFCTSLPAALPDDIAQCTSISNETQRLQCYDRAAARLSSPPQTAASEVRQLTRTPELVEPVPDNNQFDDTRLSRLDRHWELTPDAKRGVFNFRPHRKNYLIATYNPDPNEAPYRPFRFHSKSISENAVLRGRESKSLRLRYPEAAGPVEKRRIR